jgi:hypothetical protein
MYSFILEPRQAKHDRYQLSSVYTWSIGQKYHSVNKKTPFTASRDTNHWKYDEFIQFTVHLVSVYRFLMLLCFVTLLSYYIFRVFYVTHNFYICIFWYLHIFVVFPYPASSVPPTPWWRGLVPGPLPVTRYTQNKKSRDNFPKKILKGSVFKSSSWKRFPYIWGMRPLVIYL